MHISFTITLRHLLWVTGIGLFLYWLSQQSPDTWGFQSWIVFQRWDDPEKAVKFIRSVRPDIRVFHVRGQWYLVIGKPMWLRRILRRRKHEQPDR